MATKIEKAITVVNDTYRDHLRRAFREKFGCNIETSYSLFSMSLVSSRADEENFTEEQAAWLKAYEEGYLAALTQLRQVA